MSYGLKKRNTLKNLVSIVNYVRKITDIQSAFVTKRSLNTGDKWKVA